MLKTVEEIQRIIADNSGQTFISNRVVIAVRRVLIRRRQVRERRFWMGLVTSRKTTGGQVRGEWDRGDGEKRAKIVPHRAGHEFRNCTVTAQAGR